MRIEYLVVVALTCPGWSATLSVYPHAVQLLGKNASQVLAVTYLGSNGIERDVTLECQIGPQDGHIASVSREGEMTALEQIADRRGHVT